jgi:hypothetical protein
VKKEYSCLMTPLFSTIGMPQQTHQTSQKGSPWEPAFSKKASRVTSERKSHEAVKALHRAMNRTFSHPHSTVWVPSLSPAAFLNSSHMYTRVIRLCKPIPVVITNAERSRKRSCVLLPSECEKRANRRVNFRFMMWYRVVSRSNRSISTNHRYNSHPQIY